MNTKTRIVFCSLFKPVTDSRMYEKLAYSLSKSGQYEIIIIGHSVSEIPGKETSDILFLPLFSFGRLSVKRLFAPLKLFNKLIKLKPQIIINNSVDFLLIIALYKSIYQSKFIYDIQENYYFNILSNKYIPKIIRTLSAILVRSTELISSFFVDSYILAEKTYEQEIGFIKSKNYLVLENKFANLNPTTTSRPKPLESDRITLIYSGTIAEHYGIFETISFISGFHNRYSNIHLHIIGYCPHRKTYSRIMQMIKSLDFIELSGGSKLVPHAEIIKAIQNADAGIINYYINPSTENRIPTRLFEYLGNNLPVLVQDHKPWSDIVLQVNGGFIVDFKSSNYMSIFNQLTTSSFYNKTNSYNFLWESEESKLINLISRIF